ncbi:MAG: type II and III secretion system protein family protein [Deltaproteobacteria bacterium]|nr:type II and III secretion system protein family protein [Deltaproteobacteria bacterium]
MRANLIAVLLLLVMIPVARAQGPDAPIQVPVSGSKHIRLGLPIVRVSMGSSDIADIAAFPPDQLLLTGKRPGETTATVWTKNDEVHILQVSVTYPVEQMTQLLQRSVQGKHVRITSAGASLVISGEVESPAEVERAEQLVRGLAAASMGSGEPPQVVNALKVMGDYQVQLEVSFAEVSRTGLRQLGMNFWHKGSDNNYVSGLLGPGTGLQGLAPDVGGGATSTLQNPTAKGLPVINTPLSSAFGVIFANLGGSAFPFSAALSVLSSRGYARTLSEPTLVAMNGQEATFLAGGEFPIPIPQGLGQTSVDFKKFGVQLRFVPTVIQDTIQLKMATTVSDLDFSVPLVLAGTRVPGLTERHSSTTVRLRDGQSFAIAGLLSDKVRSTVDKVPGLGDLPVLGALFRSTTYQREESELLVVVTARLVRPQGEKPFLPGEDTTTDPSDLELFLIGTTESKPASGETRRARPAPTSKPVGPVGFKR